jgi:hypothetical protein
LISKSENEGGIIFQLNKAFEKKKFKELKID